MFWQGALKAIAVRDDGTRAAYFWLVSPIKPTKLCVLREIQCWDQPCESIAIEHAKKAPL
jgi:hypothetical protein